MYIQLVLSFVIICIIINKMSFCLIICEIFNENIHGIDENSDSTIRGHYLVTYNISRINAEYELLASNSLIKFS